jgi:hypothetical protein
MFPLMLAPLCHLYPIMLGRRKPWLWLKQPSMATTSDPSVSPKVSLGAEAGKWREWESEFALDFDYFSCLYITFVSLGHP